MKKVFFIMSTDAFSGAEAVNFTVIDRLKDEYDFYWVSRRGSINSFLEERGIKWIEIKDMSVGEIRRVIREGRPDILHATDYRASVISAMAKGRVKLVSHLHSNSPWLGSLCPNSVALLFAAWRSSEVLAVSESVEKEYIFAPLAKGKFLNISNPVYREKILSLAGEQSVRDYDICCVGRVTEAKGPMRFLSIVSEIRKSIPKLRVLWVGGGELEGEFLEKIKELGLEDSVDYVGFQRNPYEYLKRAKLFMLASSWEGYGLVAYEALTLGLPCVVANVGGLPEIVDSTCGRLCNSDEDYISFALELLSDKEKLDSYSLAALERSRKLDNIDEYMDTLRSIYER